MKTTTYLKFLTIALFVFQGKLFAQTYPAYLCGNNASVTLVPSGITPATGDIYVWVETTGGSNTQVQSSTTANYLTPVGLSVGEHTYQVHIISAAPAGCTGDPSADIKIYQLPATVLTMSNPTLANYCTNASPAPTSTFTATSTPAQTLPTGVGYAYVWTALKDGTPLASAASIGTITTSSNTLTNTFAITTTTVGVYALNVTSSYVVPTGSILKSSDNADCVNTNSSGAKSVTVSPKPSQPTITII